MKTISIGLLGCGTVGTGVAKLLIENQQLLAARVGVVGSAEDFESVNVSCQL